MQDRIADLETRLASVEQRLSALEGAAAKDTALEREEFEPSLGDGFVASASTHIGRVLLIFGGAYLLRAITDFQFVPTAVGLSIGAGYALFWLYMAWRNASTEDRRANAAFYGATSVLLALPLLVEAITRFQLLTGSQAIAALGVFFAMCMTVAVRTNLRSLAWLVTAGSILTALAVLIVSHEAVLVAGFLLLLGLVSLWATYVRQWLALQWLGAIGANAGAIELIVFGRSEQWALDSSAAQYFGAALLAAYLASFAIRSHRHGRDMGVFETVQILIVAGLAFWAASDATQFPAPGLGGIGAFGLVLGVCAYALALAPATRSRRGPNFFYYSLLGLLLFATGTGLILPAYAAAALWALLAIIAAWFSGRTGWVSLSLQSTLLLVAAGIVSGLLVTGLEALSGTPEGEWPELVGWHAAIALTTVACLFIPVAQHSDRWGTAAGLPQLVVLGLSVGEVGGLMVIYLAPLLAGVNSQEPNLAVLAALRTALLSISSVTLALSSRHRRWPEARWLVYPVLVLVGIKLFIEDFPNGQPATLFVALAFVGSALLIVAKLLRRAESAE
ncbi:MAG: hypothetical protein ACO22K_01015 [Woeseiaceae bacterium]|jgi:hypothetical protein